MKKKTPDRKMIMTLAGVAVVAGSVVAIADYVKRKKHNKVAHVAELAFGIAGVAAGTLLATEPRREANRITLELDDIFEGVDIELARRQVREALNRGDAEPEPEPEQPVIVIEAEPVAEAEVAVTVEAEPVVEAEVVVEAAAEEAAAEESAEA